MIKKYTKQAVLGAAILMLLLNVFCAYMYTGYSQKTANAFNDVAEMNISFSLLIMFVVSAAVIVVVLVKFIYDYCKKAKSFSFYNWAAIGLLLELVVILNTFISIINLK